MGGVSEVAAEGVTVWCMCCGFSRIVTPDDAQDGCPRCGVCNNWTENWDDLGMAAKAASFGDL